MGDKVGLEAAKIEREREKYMFFYAGNRAKIPR